MSDGRRGIASTVTLEGVGLHFGAPCQLSFVPAPPGAGVAFRRTDIADAPLVPADVRHAVLSERRTQLGTGPAALHTVEHVLAAVLGSGIDDVTIEMNGSEPPILDGSALPFVVALTGAHIVEYPAPPVRYIELTEPVRVIDGESIYEAHPSPDFRVDVMIDFPHPAVGRQSGSYRITPDTFASELAGARTFGFVSEVEMLRARGLIRGASTDNVVVLDDTGVVGGALRWPDEFVRHKALDCVGDLALAGARLKAHIVASKPSHRGTVTLVREIAKVAMTEKQRTFSIDEIMKVIPHRYPFLFVDRVIDFEPRKRIVGIKNVTINEPFFQGHFPGHAIMPGVLIIEAMAQVGGMLLMGELDEPGSKVVYFMSLDNVKFRRPVRPGDQLRFELEMTQIRGHVCRMRGVAKVDGDVVAEAEMAAMVRDR